MSPTILDDIARPENPAPLSEGDVFAAVRDFTLTYALPGLGPVAIFQGPQDKAALPAEGEEYAVITVISSTRHGTTVETFSAPEADTSIPGRLSVKALMKVAAQVEFYPASDVSRLRAQRLAVVACSSIGVQFFNDRGMSSLYTEDVRAQGDAEQPPRCYATVLHLSLWSGEVVEFPYFDTASVGRLEDVDVHHKP